MKKLSLRPSVLLGVGIQSAADVFSDDGAALRRALDKVDQVRVGAEEQLPRVQEAEQVRQLLELRVALRDAQRSGRQVVGARREQRVQLAVERCRRHRALPRTVHQRHALARQRGLDAHKQLRQAGVIANHVVQNLVLRRQAPTGVQRTGPLLRHRRHHGVGHHR
jgi:hypothetical protein